jgi:hypothetical protein
MTLDNKTPKPKHRKITEKERDARRQNIVTFNAERGNRPALKSGIQSTAVQNGKVPPEFPDANEINGEVDALVAEIVADLGGESEVTANRKTIVAAQRTTLTVLALAQRYLVREGLVNRRGKPHPLLKLLVSYINAARLNAVSLGLERRAKRINDLESIAVEYAEKAAVSPEPTGPVEVAP